MELIYAAIVIVACFSGAISSIAGFGLTTMLTPVVALLVGTKVAVAAVAIPHCVCLAVRLAVLRKLINWKVFLSFGVMSAVGSVAGALLHAVISGLWITAIFTVVLVLAVASCLAPAQKRPRFSGVLGWIAGGFSGVLGGLTGNHGGIRAAAMLGLYEMDKDTYIATVTAIGLIVDVARLPVYLWVHGHALMNLGPVIGMCTIAGLIGTCVGMGLLKNMPERVFRPVILTLIIVTALGAVIHDFSGHVMPMAFADTVSFNNRPPVSFEAAAQLRH